LHQNQQINTCLQSKQEIKRVRGDLGGDWRRKTWKSEKQGSGKEREG